MAARERAVFGAVLHLQFSAAEYGRLTLCELNEFRRVIKEINKR